MFGWNRTRGRHRPKRMVDAFPAGGWVPARPAKLGKNWAGTDQKFAKRYMRLILIRQVSVCFQAGVGWSMSKRGRYQPKW